MGCGSSKQVTEVHELAARPKSQRRQGAPTISGPQGGLQLVPAPERDTSGRPVKHQEHNLTRRNLQRALHYVAEFLGHRGKELTLIAVGGAVNTIHLQSREATHDVDFFSANLAYRASAADLLRSAALNAAARSSVPLGGNWLNNATSLFMGAEIQRELTQQAMEQNCVIFQETGLKVLAAPWHYALCGKIDRMCKPEKREYDGADAARYLHQYLIARGKNSVAVSQIQGWSAHFRLLFSAKAVREVNYEFQKRWGQDGVQF